MKGLDDLIGGASVFAGLEPRWLELIAGCAGNEHVRAGTYLFQEGQPADRFYLVRHGAIALEINAPASGSHVVETLGEGELVDGLGCSSPTGGSSTPGRPRRRG